VFVLIKMIFNNPVQQLAALSASLE